MMTSSQLLSQGAQPLWGARVGLSIKTSEDVTMARGHLD